MTNITYNNLSLQGANIITSEIQHEDASHIRLNFQKFGTGEGSNLGFWSTGFDVKRITLKGIIKGSSKSDLEDRVDDFKRSLQSYEKNLDIDYVNGSRRYVCSCSSIKFSRNFYTIDVMGWEAEFIVSNPPFGIDLDTSTLEYLGLTNTAVSTTTIETLEYPVFGGTVRPKPTVNLTINSCNGVRSIRFMNTRDDGYLTSTVINNHKFYDGDIITINTKDGEVQVNGTDVEFRDGLPNFSLNANKLNLRVVATSYNIDVKLIYYKYWI